MKQAFPQGVSTRDLWGAIQADASTHLKYLIFAQAARARGNIQIADLFERVARVEWQEHCAARAEAAKVTFIAMSTSPRQAGTWPAPQRRRA
jgi:rubrerythrin